jgi:hypothetical protein
MVRQNGAKAGASTKLEGNRRSSFSRSRDGLGYFNGFIREFCWLAALTDVKSTPF